MEKTNKIPADFDQRWFLGRRRNHNGNRINATEENSNPHDEITEKLEDAEEQINTI